MSTSLRWLVSRVYAVLAFVVKLVASLLIVSITCLLLAIMAVLGVFVIVLRTLAEVLSATLAWVWSDAKLSTLKQMPSYSAATLRRFIRRIVQLRHVFIVSNSSQTPDARE